MYCVSTSFSFGFESQCERGTSLAPRYKNFRTGEEHGMAEETADESRAEDNKTKHDGTKDRIAKQDRWSNKTRQDGTEDQTVVRLFDREDNKTRQMGQTKKRLNR
jgi:hypothetical protein